MPRIGDNSQRVALRTLLISVWIGLLVGGVTDTAAQTFLLRHNGLERNLAGVVYQKPWFHGDGQVSTMSGTYEFIGGTNMTRTLDFTCSLAVPVFADDADSLDNSPANVTVGLRKVTHDWTNDSRWWFVNLTAGTYRNHDGSSAPLATLTNIHEYQKYTPNAWCLAAGWGYLSAANYGGWMYGGAVQPKFTFDGFSGDDRHELVVDYQLDIGWRAEVFQALAELYGSVGVSDRLQQTDTRFAHTLALGVEMRWEWLRPGIYYNLPLTSALADYLDGTLVLQVFVTFSR